MKELFDNVDLLIMILNEKLLVVFGFKISLFDVFKVANDVLLGVVQGIVDLIICFGMINVDFVDVCIVMFEMGMVMMGIGFVSGESCVCEVVEKVICSLLLEDVNLEGVCGILVNIIVGESLLLGEFFEVGDMVEEFVLDNVIVVVGIVIDFSMGDDFCVIVVVIGFGVVGE